MLAAFACAAVVPDPVRAQGSGRDGEALEAYRALSDYGEEEEYLARYAPRLSCFYGEENVPRARLRMRYLIGAATTSFQLDVLESRPDRVTLLDRGHHGQDGNVGVHEKIVVMRRIGGRWLVAAETSARYDGCMHDWFLRAPPAPPRFGVCRRLAEPLRREMRRVCATESVMGCAAVSESASETLTLCFDGGVLDTRSLPRRVRRLSDVPWAGLPYFYRPFWGSHQGSARFEDVAYIDIDGDGEDEVLVALRRPEGGLFIAAFDLWLRQVVELDLYWEQDESPSSVEGQRHLTFDSARTDAGGTVVLTFSTAPAPGAPSSGTTTVRMGP